MGGLDRMIENCHAHGVATGSAEADEFLRTEPGAILVAVLLDQQVRAEMAFAGPYKLKERLGHFDLNRIAAMDEEAFAGVFGQKPAVHRFANMMAAKVQSLARAVSERYDGNAERLWGDGADLATVRRRVAELPGFGPSKVHMIGAVLELFGHRTFD